MSGLSRLLAAACSGLLLLSAVATAQNTSSEGEHIPCVRFAS